MIIACSGASNSGKSTYIKFLQENISNVIVYDEIIRGYDIGSIDEIRSKPDEYFKIQKEIVYAKRQQEQTALQLSYKNNADRELHVFDRSMIDSFYYYFRYVRVELLSDKSKKEYYEFMDNVFVWARESLNTIYDKVFMFIPIRMQKNNDPYREKDLYLKQDSEFNFMLYLNKGICDNADKKIIEVNAIKDNNLYRFFELLYK